MEKKLEKSYKKSKKCVTTLFYKYHYAFYQHIGSEKPLNVKKHDHFANTGTLRPSAYPLARRQINQNKIRGIQTNKKTILGLFYVSCIYDGV